MQTPEQRVQNKIIKELKLLQEKGYPIFFEKRQAGGFTYKKGLADLYCVIDGKHIEIEIKAEDGELSPMQITKKEKFNKLYNIDYLIVKSWDEVYDYIKSLKKV